MRFLLWILFIFSVLIFLGSFAKPKPDKNGKAPTEKDMGTLRKICSVLIGIAILGLIITIPKKPTKEQEIAQLKEKLQSMGQVDSTVLVNIYKRLTELEPENKEYQKQLKQISRKAEIEKQFSAWDGSHIKLTEFIKENMNDPKSYEHVKTIYWDRGDYLIVQTTFRGKNAFGGLVLNTIKANVSLDGTILKIIQ